jgi:hypothetical protein
LGGIALDGRHSDGQTEGKGGKGREWKEKGNMSIEHQYVVPDLIALAN